MDKEKILESYKSLKSERANIESKWDEIHDYFLPATDEIQRQTNNNGDLYRNGQQTDEPILALRTLVSGFHSYLTSPASDWFMLRAKDKKLNSNDNVKRFLEETEDVLRESINGTNFNTEQDLFYSSSAGYGTAVMMIEEDFEDDLRFYTIPIKNIYIEEDSKNRINAFYIKYRYTAAQAIDRFGIDNVTDQIKKIYEKSPADSTRFEFLMYVSKRHVRDESKKDALNMPYMVKWLEVEEGKEIAEGGLRTMPFAYHRWTKREETAYGYSPCMVSLRSVKKLNETLRFTLRGIAKSIDPPVVVPSKGFVGKINMNPSAIMYKKQGAADTDLQVVPTPTSIGGADYLVGYYTDMINRGLYVDVINALGGITKRMNDTEVQELIAEKMSQLGPAVGRFIDEFLNNVIARSLDILAAKGKLPEPPEELGEGFEYKIEYTSPLARAQRANELQGIQVTLGVGGQIASFDPQVLDNFNFDTIIRDVADISGTDSTIFKTQDEVAELREQRQQQQMAQQAMAMQQQGLEQAKTAQEIENA